VQGEALADAVAVLIGELDHHINPVVLIPRHLDPFLIRARDARADILHEQLPASAGAQLREVIGLKFLHLPAHRVAGKFLLQRIPQREAFAAAVAFRVGAVLSACGPKAQQQASPGQVRNERRPGSTGKKTIQAPTGRDNSQSRSIPDVSLIDLHAMLPAERAELILIGHLPMMLLLRRNVCAHLLDVRLADGE
jgi:hypothetical protein